MSSIVLVFSKNFRNFSLSLSMFMQFVTCWSWKFCKMTNRWTQNEFWKVTVTSLLSSYIFHPNEFHHYILHEYTLLMKIHNTYILALSAWLITMGAFFKIVDGKNTKIKNDFFSFHSVFHLKRIYGRKRFCSNFFFCF